MTSIAGVAARAEPTSLIGCVDVQAIVASRVAVEIQRRRTAHTGRMNQDTGVPRGMVNASAWADRAGDISFFRSTHVALLRRVVGGTLGPVYGRRVIRR